MDVSVCDRKDDDVFDDVICQLIDPLIMCVEISVSYFLIYFKSEFIWFTEITYIFIDYFKK